MALFGVVSVQGGPATGRRRFGVPPGGAFDRESLALANALAGNPADAPGVELSRAAASFRAHGEGWLALVGAEATVRVGAREMPVGGGFRVTAGDLVEVSAPTRGARVYLAWFGSSGESSASRGLRVGDRIGSLSAVGAWSPVRLAEMPSSLGVRPVRVVAGPQAGLFDLDAFLGAEFVVGRASDRVGLRLEGEGLPHGYELPSEPACPGVVQVTPAGTPIVLGPEGPTLGGYPKIAVVTTVDLDRVGQWVPGQRVAFEVVSVEEARGLAAARRREMARRLAEVRLGAGNDFNL